MDNFNMDKITLEYFTNKQTYKRYLAKHDPSKSKIQLYQDIHEHKNELQLLFSTLLENADDSQYSNLLPKYELFMEACLYHLANLKDQENTSQEDNPYHKDSEDTIFDKCEDVKILPTSNIEFWKAAQVTRR
uniref:Uncharacterized protein n=1 Tax=viral metagenome TaxID=1070528 RepID=A0A6C0CKS9_9ZZZZ